MSETLVYLLSLYHQADTALPVVELCLVQRLTNKRYSKPKPLLNTEALLTEDELIYQALLQLKQEFNIELPAEKFPLAGTNSAELMEQLIATERCHWVTANSAPLTLGLARKAQLDWLTEPNGLRRLQCRIPGQAHTNLALMPPWYLDQMRACCGPLEINYDPNLVALLLLCPPLPLEQLEQIIAEFNPSDLKSFLTSAAGILQQAGWPAKTSGTHYLLETSNDWYVKVNQEHAMDWFDLELGINLAGEHINILPILLDLIHNHPISAKSDATFFAKLPNGHSLPISKERLQYLLSILTELYDEASLNKHQQLRISRARAGQLLHLQDALGLQKLEWQGGERLRALGKRLQNFNGIPEAVIPEDLHTDLRGYQQEGVNWLQFLRDYDLAGILADDMGLGKTVQTLAHLLIEKHAKRMDKPSLLIIPTSLVLNWQAEAKRFTPNLKLLTLHGSKRLENLHDIPNYDVIITTYPLLVRDKDYLLAHQYHYIILDEAHIIKNPRAKVTHVVQQLQSRHRLCLTGTPLENNLRELWSLYNFLLPGLLGSHEQFRRLFQVPIEKSGDNAKRDSLTQRIKPFLLRRTKEEVLQELPAKTEIIQQVELQDEQRDLYESIRISVQQKVLQAIGGKGLSQSYLTVLEALLRLRQVCCDPRLLKLKTTQEKTIPSAKLILLLEMLDNLAAEGRRVIIFSQFAQMLALIASALEEQKLDYVMLTGKTKDRHTPVQRFQAGQVPIFLISLKAGGMGLNLTAADTVIHYDPWWNPAVERQATDRAHRIGQDKPIFVYKLITSCTVEEKIIALQQHKQALLDGVFNQAQTNKFELTTSDLETLFAPLA